MDPAPVLGLQHQASQEVIWTGQQNQDAKGAFQKHLQAGRIGPAIAWKGQDMVKGLGVRKRNKLKSILHAALGSEFPEQYLLFISWTFSLLCGISFPETPLHFISFLFTPEGFNPVVPVLFVFLLPQLLYWSSKKPHIDTNYIYDSTGILRVFPIVAQLSGAAFISTCSLG